MKLESYCFKKAKRWWYSYNGKWRMAFCPDKPKTIVIIGLNRKTRYLWFKKDGGLSIDWINLPKYVTSQAIWMLENETLETHETEKECQTTKKKYGND